MSSGSEVQAPTTPTDPNAPHRAGAAGYHVARPHGSCTACGKPIEPDAKFMAVLRETPQGFERADFCLPCWDAFDQAAAGNTIVGFWKTTMPRHEAKKKLFVDDEVLCNLFERLADATEQAKINFRFVLGLVLMRKRLLMYEGTRTADNPAREFWIVKFKGRDQTMEMLNPQLAEGDLQDISQQLGQILSEDA